MHLGNVINFPGKRGVSSGGVSGMGGTPVEVDAPNAVDAAGSPTPQAPAAEQLLARAGNSLELARRATIGLVGRSVPGSVEVGLFNQYGIIQNALAQLSARVGAATGDAELAAISVDLEGVEKQTSDYAAAVDAALANAPAVTVADSKKLWWIGGSVLAVLAAVGAIVYLRKPARRKKLAGLFGLAGAPAALSSGEPKSKPRKPKKRGGRRLKK